MGLGLLGGKSISVESLPIGTGKFWFLPHCYSKTGVKQDRPTSPLHMLEIKLVKACKFAWQKFVVLLLKWLTVERLIRLISVDEGPPPSLPKILHLMFKIQHGLVQAFLASFPSSKHWPSSCPPHVSRGSSLTVHTKHQAFSSRVSESRASQDWAPGKLHFYRLFTRRRNARLPIRLPSKLLPPYPFQRVPNCGVWPPVQGLKSM